MSKRKYMRNPANFNGQANLEKQIAENRKKGDGCGLSVLVFLVTVLTPAVGAVATWLT